MEFLKFIRLDVICALVLVSTIIVETMKNQSKVWRNAICLLLSTGLVGVFCYFNFFGLFGKLMSFLNAKAFIPFSQWKLIAVDDVNLNIFLGVITVVAMIFVLDLVLIGISSIFGSGEGRKYKKDLKYASSYLPVMSFFGGLIKAVLLVYIVYFVWVNFAAYRGFSLEADFLYKFVKNYVPFIGHIRDIISSFVGA